MKLNNFIMSHKGSTILVMLGLIAFYDQWDNPTAWVYLGLHGGYGLLWIMKSIFFPDPNWEKLVSLHYGILVGWGSLTTYWIAPWLLCSRGIHSPVWLLSVCILVYLLGAFLHFTADMQKYTALRYRPHHLVTEGVWSISRNPNYFGEFLIYLSLAVLVLHWVPVAILLLWVGVYWLPNMIRKDRSLAKYPEFQAYQKKTRLFIPFIL